MVKPLETLSEKEKAVLQTLTDKEKAVVGKLARTKQGVLERFPLLFTMLGAFGLVATFYGFEHLIDKSQFLSDNPLILLAVGVSALLFTGKLYSKLG